MNRFDITKTIGYCILDVARHMGKHLDDTHGDVTMAQGVVLYYLEKAGNDCVIQQDLAEILKINKSGLLRTIDILEKMGLLKRYPVLNDRRKNKVELTPSGEKEVESFVAALSAKNAKLEALFKPQEIETFFKVLDAMKTSIMEGKESVKT